MADPVLGLFSWLVRDAVGPHLVGRLLDGRPGRPKQWAAQVAELAAAELPEILDRGRRRELRTWLDSDHVWASLCTLTSDDESLLLTGIEQSVGLDRESASATLELVCAGFLQSLDAALAASIAEYRRAADFASMQRCLMSMGDVLARAVAERQLGASGNVPVEDRSIKIAPERDAFVVFNTTQSTEPTIRSEEIERQLSYVNRLASTGHLDRLERSLVKVKLTVRFMEDQSW